MPVTSMFCVPLSSLRLTLSSPATGALFDGPDTDTVTVAVSVPPLPSLIV
ncbi:hypothetical protein R2601_04523 [Salipiger bermudensis HTCC2601]|uniref:Uncharacterized protein n=1 Tax=Salipiger bermudensis (strain DSM 26914 / JCM 13377 / KCTC 12554 / HTCC2601) TaxID=314265 RepID=Q0FVU1_SALBH|nr:hypothetical protein R2601_04523 [Salipiger bermudensis HTCC2601]